MLRRALDLVKKIYEKRGSIPYIRAGAHDLGQGHSGLRSMGSRDSHAMDTPQIPLSPGVDSFGGIDPRAAYAEASRRGAGSRGEAQSRGRVWPIPEALFILNVNDNSIPIKEAMKLQSSVTGITDSDTNPFGVQYPIPGNNDSIESLSVYTASSHNAIADAKENESTKICSSQLRRFTGPSDLREDLRNRTNMSDSPSHSCSHTRNGQRNRILVIESVQTKSVTAVPNIPQDHGYTRGYRFHQNASNKPQTLPKHKNQKPVINKIIRTPKPSKRVYIAAGAPAITGPRGRALEEAKIKLSRSTYTASAPLQANAADDHAGHCASSGHQLNSLFFMKGIFILSTSKGV
jgi:ribosomal protein S8